MKYDRLKTFRQDTYSMLGKAHDATFELMDSVMTTRNASCLAEFSLSPLFRRKWSSVYEALQDNRPNRNKLMRRYIQEIDSSEYILLAIDHTAWGRRGAKTLQDRTYEHQANANNSVTVGQGYSTIAWLPDNQGSWALPLQHERITSYENPISKAAWQLWLARDLVQQHHLPWQSQEKNLTPGRVAQSMFSLLVEIDTPTIAPKPRGKSPGWKAGQKRRKRKTYPIAKKSYSPAKKLNN
jgi:hypothetical protein